MIAGSNGGHDVASLIREWRHDASVLERRGDSRGSHLLAVLADELEARLFTHADELLNLRDASVECGYSEDHLGRLIRQGKLPNLGRLHAPRIRRRDLPIRKQKAHAVADLQRENRIDGFLRDIITSKFGER